MKPLTPRRIFGVCGLVLAVLFVVVVISLRMGAYPISISEIVMTLFRGVAGQREQIPSEFWLVVFGLRLPRIALGILVGAALSTAGRSTTTAGGCKCRTPMRSNEAQYMAMH